MRKGFTLIDILVVLAIIAVLTSLIYFGTQKDDAEVASYNISKAADNFGVQRRLVFYNGITGEYMLTIEGSLSILDQGNQLEVTVKTGDNEYKKHFLGLSDNVTYFAEQLDGKNVSVNHYRVVFKPSVIVPDIEIR